MFRLCSEFLAQTLVYSEFLDFVVNASQIAPLQNHPRQYRPHIYQNNPIQNVHTFIYFVHIEVWYIQFKQRQNRYLYHTGARGTELPPPPFYFLFTFLFSITFRYFFYNFNSFSSSSSTHVHKFYFVFFTND
jgi:hypothetical protein